jgi:hypothetical protein
MKKATLLLIGLLVFYSCLDNDNNEVDFTYEYLTIDEAITPASFTFGKQDSITIKYSLPNNCYSFNRLFYEYRDTTRVVAVFALVDLNNSICTQQIIPKEYKFAVTATQREDYIFKFYKGEDSGGESIFDEIVVPVN